jgi:hypothetical protein
VRIEERLALDASARTLHDLALAAPSGSVLVGHQPELLGLLAGLLPGGSGLPALLPPAALVGLRVGDGGAVLRLYVEPPAAAAWRDAGASS